MKSRLLRIGLVLLPVILAVVIAWRLALLPSPSGFSNEDPDLPEVPSADQAMMDRASASQGGQLLTSTGYKAVALVSNEEVIKFLDEHQRGAGLDNPGPYVVFSLGKPEVAQAEDNGYTDPVVDAASGTIVAVSQEFTNRRGTICYNVQTVDVVQGNWVLINEYLRGKGMPLEIVVTRQLVPQLPVGFPDTPCYIYFTS